jgi:hypothetical protein
MYMPRKATIFRTTLLLLGMMLWTSPSWGQTTTYAGKLVGGVKYEIPGWFKDSFLELESDAAEAAEADRHAIVFVHAPE